MTRKDFPEHFTGSAVVIDPSRTRVCLLLHAKLNRWLQPGGHGELQDGGSLVETALREAREETGLPVHLVSPALLDVDAHVIPARGDEPEHTHLDCRFLVQAESDALAIDPNESNGARWLSFDDAIAAATEPPMRRMLEKARDAVAKNA